MRRVLAGLLLLVLVTSGCAHVMDAVEKFPQRTQDALSDPIRREHLLTKVGLEFTSTAVALGVCLATGPIAPACLAVSVVGVVANYLIFEYVLEPWSRKRVEEGKSSLVGPYWEGGPRDGERFINP